ncbi:hypothetical protein BZA70DRAFT_167534 [Myxozyma melibiosi]|uniref:Uncharacterized protein n=1 Tax=Myxozyma melibiosi TaxID=54550 RepID=A0ABR1F565_9ASCO
MDAVEVSRVFNEPRQVCLKRRADWFVCLYLRSGELVVGRRFHLHACKMEDRSLVCLDTCCFSEYRYLRLNQQNKLIYLTLNLFTARPTQTTATSKHFFCSPARPGRLSAIPRDFNILTNILHKDSSSPRAKPESNNKPPSKPDLSLNPRINSSTQSTPKSLAFGLVCDSCLDCGGSRAGFIASFKQGYVSSYEIIRGVKPKVDKHTNSSLRSFTSGSS